VDGVGRRFLIEWRPASNRPAVSGEATGSAGHSAALAGLAYCTPRMATQTVRTSSCPDRPGDGGARCPDADLL